jgi:CO/xanthine dehydrogenase FAD-binding subunit
MGRLKPNSFAYYRPNSVASALQCLATQPDAKILAGGQSLVPAMNFRLSRPACLIDINGIEELANVAVREDKLVLGALLHHQQIHEHPSIRQHVPVLAEAAGEIGHLAIRNRGTLGGSLVHADPASELPAAMVALHAVMEVAGVDGTRSIPATEFFVGWMTTALDAGEMLVSVHLPRASSSVYGFAEFARRPGDFAYVGAFVERTADESGAVTWFGVTDKPEYRPVPNLPREATARQAEWQELAASLEVLDEPRMRRQLAAVLAERAYQKVGEAVFG